MTGLALGSVITPTGVFLGAPEPGSDEWVALRVAGITGTDMAAILGYSRRDNARTVWHHKRGDAIERREDDELNEAARWGVLLEPVVADEWARRQKAMIADGGHFAHAMHPWRRAQVDRLVAVCPDAEDQTTLLCALEVKTRNAFVAGTWLDDVPDDVLAQVAWQRMVTGLDHIHVACLIGGQKPVNHTYVRDDQLESFLLTAAEEVWEHVTDDTPPPVDWDAIMSDLLDALAPDRSGTRELDHAEFTTLMAEWRAKQEAERLALLAKARVDGKIKNAMGEGDDAVEVLTYGGEPVFTWREQDRRGYTVEPTSFRVLRGPQR